MFKQCLKEFKSRAGVVSKGDFGPLHFPFESGPKSNIWTKVNFNDQNRFLTRDHNFRREIKVDQNHLLEATPTRDLNSFKHLSGPKNKTFRKSKPKRTLASKRDYSGVN